MTGAAARREVLLAMPAAVVGMVPSLPYVGKNGDAELLELWERYLAVHEVFRRSHEGDCEPFQPAWRAIAERMRAIVPTTMEGVVAQLRVGMMRGEACTIACDRYVNRRAVSGDMVRIEIGEGHLWHVLLSLERALGIEPRLRMRAAA